MPQENVLDQFSEKAPVEHVEEEKDKTNENPLDNFGDEKDENLEGDKGKKEEDDDEDDDKPNRWTRRREAAYQRERETNIALAARLEAMSESQRFSREIGEMPIDERLVTLYGNDENGKRAAQITQSLLQDVAKQAKEDAVKEFQAAREREREELVQNQDFIDGELEQLEDASGIDLTSNKPSAVKARAEFLGMVEKFSPKDAEGNITAYADFDQVFGIYMQGREKGNTRSKELASRGMVRSGASASQTKADVAAGEKFLKENGII